MKEEIKTTTKHYCGDFKEELNLVGTGFDMFSFIEPLSTRYCSNNKCDRYGVVTVASIPQKITK